MSPIASDLRFAMLSRILLALRLSLIVLSRLLLLRHNLTFGLFESILSCYQASLQAMSVHALRAKGRGRR